VHLVLDQDHFVSGQSLDAAADLSHFNLTVETGNTAAHTSQLHFTTSVADSYSLSDTSGTLTTVTVQPNQEVIFNLPFAAGGATKTFSITKQ
jgi:hypothetical protein